MDQVSHFRRWKFTHTKRQGDVPGHLLAQHAKYVEDYGPFELNLLLLKLKTENTVAK